MDKDYVGRCERCGLIVPEEDLISIMINGSEELWDYGCIEGAKENGEEVTILDGFEEDGS